MMIDELFCSYKEITLKIVELLEENNDNVDKLMKERDDILNDLGNLDILKEEKRRVYDSFELSALDKKLEQVIKKNMEEIKAEIRKNANRRTAHSTYASNMRQGNLFVKKV